MNRWWTLGLMATLSGAPGAFTCPQSEVCDGLDNDGDGDIDEGFDDDLDGYLDGDSCIGEIGSLDCDDGDASINPGALEACDLIDNDCDGLVDEGVGDIDADGDGVTCALDCDEGDDTVFPGAPERCDGLDNDCDGAFDEDFDADGDSFATCAGDCDDSRADVYPGSLEVVGDGIDNNCDGVSDATAIVRLEGPNPEPSKPLFRTIQGAINAAINGEIIAIYGGSYWESLDLLGKGVTLVGVEGALATTVDAGKAGRGILIQGGQGSRAVIRDLSFIGGSEAQGGGALIDGVSPSIIGCRFTRNQGDEGGGLALIGGAAPTLDSVFFSDNSALHGGGIFVGAGSELVLLEATFQTNAAHELVDVDVVETIGDDGATYQVLRYSYGGQGGAIYLAPGAKAEVEGGSFDFNYALEGGGIFHGGESLLVIGAEFRGNEALGLDEELLGGDIPALGERLSYLGRGGAMLMAGPATLRDVFLRSNISIFGGGIATVAGGDVEGLGISTSGNEGFGALMTVTKGDDYVTDYGGGGGAFAALGGSLDIQTLSSQGDRSIYGGGVYVDGGDISLRGGELLSSQAQGVLQVDSAEGTTLLGGLGGGIFHRRGAANFESVIINGAQAYQGGGGVYLSGDAASEGGVTLSNLSIVGGGAPIGGGINLDTGEGDITLRNLIVAFSLNGGGIQGPIPGGALTYSDVYLNGGGDLPGNEGLIGAEGNISLDPGFVSYGEGAGPAEDSLKLTVLSPAKDSGDPNPTLNDADGSPGDMGAYGGPAGDTLP